MEHVFAPETKLSEAFTTFVSRNSTGRERQMYTVSSVFDELEKSLGWVRKRYNHNTIPGYDILNDAYDAWMNSIMGEVADDEEEDNDDDDSTK